MHLFRSFVAVLIAGLMAFAFAQDPLVYLRCGADTEPFAREQVDDFTAATGIEVELQIVPWQQCFQRLQTSIGSGNAPDVAYVGSRFIPSLAELGALAPIDVPDDRRAEYYGSIWDMVTWNGDIYGMPVAFSTKVVFYNLDVLEEAGVDTSQLPTTWDEFYSVAEQVEENTGKVGYTLAGVKFVATTTQFFNFLFSNGGRVFDDDGNVVINSPEGIETMEFYGRLTNVSQPGPVSGNRAELWQLLAQNEAAMYISGPWRRNNFDEAGINYTTGPIPVGPSGDMSRPTLVSDSLIISAQSDRLDDANELVLFLGSEEQQAYMDRNFGFTPMRPTIAEDPYFVEDETWQDFIEAVPNGVAQPLVADWNLLEDLVTDAIQAVFLGESTPQAAMDELAAELEREFN